MLVACHTIGRTALLGQRFDNEQPRDDRRLSFHHGEKGLVSRHRLYTNDSHSCDRRSSLREHESRILRSKSLGPLGTVDARFRAKSLARTEAAGRPPLKIIDLGNDPISVVVLPKLDAWVRVPSPAPEVVDA